ncbi:MAG: hypothetical protein WCX88_01970 [Patescibacteria group bacterium]
MLNFNWKQYVLSGILLILVFVLGLQINYNRQDDTEILSYVPKEAIFLLKLDLTTQNKNCLLGHWCFVDDQKNELLTWLTDDQRHARILENFSSDTSQIQDLVNKINSKLYLVGLVDQATQKIKPVFLTPAYSISPEITQALLKAGFVMGKQNTWLIFGKDQASLDSILSQKASQQVYFNNFSPVGLDQFISKHKPFLQGFFERQNLTEWLAQQDNLVFQELNSSLASEKLPETINLLAWFENKNLNFTLISQDMLREVGLDEAYADLKFDPLFKLQPQIILDKSKNGSDAGLNTASLLNYFSLEKYIQPERFIWFNLVNPEKEFVADKILAQSQVLIVPALDKNKLELFKNELKLKLAHKIPSERDLILPDKSVATELIADPSKFEFKTDKMKDYRLEYLSEPAVNFEVVMAIDDTKMILADSKEVLSNLIYSNGEIIDKMWQNESSSDKAFFNFSNQQKSFYGLENVLVEDLSWGNNVWVRGEIR